jgi:hypothetical protein
MSGMGKDKILERIERETGVADLAALLAERLEPADLHSLLLEVYRRRADRRSPAAVLSDFESNRFVRPARTDPGELLRWEQVAFASLPEEFETIELSPVCPLGTSSVIATVSQNKSLATIRNVEVVSDATNVLALECALRRRTLLRQEPKSPTPVHLATSHRLLRTQAYEDSNLQQHFRLFMLCSAGRDVGGGRFQIEALSEHIRSFLRAARSFVGPGLYLRVSVTDLSPDSSQGGFGSQVLAALEGQFPDVDFRIDPSRQTGRGYYSEVCFHVHAILPSVGSLELADGGAVDWTQKLLSNAKERLVISGISGERLCSLVRD